MTDEPTAPTADSPPTSDEGWSAAMQHDGGRTYWKSEGLQQAYRDHLARSAANVPAVAPQNPRVAEIQGMMADTNGKYWHDEGLQAEYRQLIGGESVQPPARIAPASPAPAVSAAEGFSPAAFRGELAQTREGKALLDEWGADADQKALDIHFAEREVFDGLPETEIARFLSQFRTWPMDLRVTLVRRFAALGARLR